MTPWGDWLVGSWLVFENTYLKPRLERLQSKLGSFKSEELRSPRRPHPFLLFSILSKKLRTRRKTQQHGPCGNAHRDSCTVVCKKAHHLLEDTTNES